MMCIIREFNPARNVLGKAWRQSVFKHCRRGNASLPGWLQTVETDRGETMFLLRDEEDIRRLGHGALLIAGSEGVQYSIADMAALERGSRRLLERFL